MNLRKDLEDFTNDHDLEGNVTRWYQSKALVLVVIGLLVIVFAWPQFSQLLQILIGSP